MARMEGFEHLVKVALEAEGYVVTSNLKFPVRRRTSKQAYDEHQTHGYEVDLVGAKCNALVIASFFGSIGVNRQGFLGIADGAKKTHFGLYKIFNEDEIRDGVIDEAAKRFGYSADKIYVRLYVGKFKPGDVVDVRRHVRQIRAGAGQIEVIGLDEVLRRLLPLADVKTYINDPVVITLKALKFAGYLGQKIPARHLQKRTGQGPSSQNSLHQI
jgi:hypothetical protein